VDNFKVSVSFDDGKLKELRRKAKNLNGQTEVPLSELFPNDFIRKYTNFQTLQAMIDTSGIKSPEEIGNEEFCKFISLHTQFSSWEEMLRAATFSYTNSYTKRKLGL